MCVVCVLDAVAENYLRPTLRRVERVSYIREKEGLVVGSLVVGKNTLPSPYSVGIQWCWFHKRYLNLILSSIKRSDKIDKIVGFHDATLSYSYLISILSYP